MPFALMKAANMQWNFLFIRVVVGLLATLIMDLGGGLGLLLGIASHKPQRMGHNLIGRWTGYMLRGKFRHADILATPALGAEMPFGILIHYLIGAILTLIYFAILGITPIQTNALLAVAYGLVSMVFPWFLMFPSEGMGWREETFTARLPWPGPACSITFFWNWSGCVDRGVPAALKFFLARLTPPARRSMPWSINGMA